MSTKLHGSPKVRPNADGTTDAKRTNSQLVDGDVIEDPCGALQFDVEGRGQRHETKANGASSRRPEARRLTGNGHGHWKRRNANRMHQADVVRELCDNDSLCVGEQEIFDRLFGLARCVNCEPRERAVARAFESEHEDPDQAQRHDLQLIPIARW